MLLRAEETTISPAPVLKVRQAPTSAEPSDAQLLKFLLRVSALGRADLLAMYESTSCQLDQGPQNPGAPNSSTREVLRKGDCEQQASPVLQGAGMESVVMASAANGNASAADGDERGK